MTENQIAALAERIASLPDEAQDEIVQSIVEAEAKHSGVYHLSDDERTAVRRGLQEMREGKFATDEQVRTVFDRYRVGGFDIRIPLVEIDEVLGYTARDSPRSADKLSFRLDQAIQVLAAFPETAEMDTNEPGARVGKYLIFYTIEDDEHVILHVRHSARRRPAERP